MKIVDLFESESNRRPLHWIEKQERSAILSASNKLKQLVEQTGWLRIGVSDDESGEHHYSYYLKRYDGGDGRYRGMFHTTIYGKHIPRDNDMHFADLIDADEETNKRIRDRVEKKLGKKLTAKDIERMNNKSLKMMQSLILTLIKTKFNHWTDEEGIDKTVVLDHVQWYTGSEYVRVSPEAAVENLARLYPRDKQHIEYFGRELYAPHVELYFKIKAL